MPGKTDRLSALKATTATDIQFSALIVARLARASTASPQNQSHGDLP